MFPNSESLWLSLSRDFPQPHLLSLNKGELIACLCWRSWECDILCQSYSSSHSCLCDNCYLQFLSISELCHGISLILILSLQVLWLELFCSVRPQAISSFLSCSHVAGLKGTDASCFIWNRSMLRLCVSLLFPGRFPIRKDSKAFILSP